MIPCETLFSHDRLALFGFGVFETLLVTDEAPLFVDLHWQRMNQGANFLGLKLPDKNEWLKQVQEFIEQNPSKLPWALRVTLSGGAPLSNLPSTLLFHKRLVPYTPAQYALGIRLHILPSPRNEQSPLVAIKSTNYLENILAKEAANLQGADEGVWLNTKGYLAEGTMSNLFFIKDGTLFTPSLASGCLPGTRRQLLLGLARSLQIPTYEDLYSISDLLMSDEIFMTNALMGIMPVRQIDDIPFPIAKESVMRVLELAYQDLVKHS
ncbi:probable aminodeoxychorismate lyase [Candidatus Desulfosporosinus infrequens]|uniref:aminodeoxychorismate lyase n=1 Tax=Candidatus Desulfosporosinus infrequens TaxID=2043169 RepID=A0A2U3LXU3_9FIRM|nr:probable aminodeoxychorismate lyase [Candidatus Desulfosporosinus infrequens]